ncbi:MAG TPA: cytochrome c [Steroidobacteraceae bacterium]|jgi:mono/diheme cytochrome c family protein
MGGHKMTVAMGMTAEMVEGEIDAGAARRAKGFSSGLRSSSRRVSRQILAATAAVVALAASSAVLADESGGSPAERGAYLATAGNCTSCHTREGGEAFSGGLAFTTPFGTMYSTNITPDPDTGIGKWTEEQFARAFREGVRPNGEHLYPAFPYTAFTNTSDADVAALYAYLKTLTPVSYTAPANELKFPYNQRWALGIWKAMYFKDGRYTPDKTQSDEWNRGAYLVKGLGHCGACHTPRNFLGAEDDSRAFHGGVYQDKIEDKLLDWAAPDLTSAGHGLKQWSVDELAGYLKEGYSDRAGVFGPMNEVVVNSTSHLSPEDAKAVAVYLKSLPASPPPSVSAPDEETLHAGSLQYDIHCGTCHLPTGLGSHDTGPALVGSVVALAPDPASLINITLYGAQLPAAEQWRSKKWKVMEAYGENLTDEDAAALLTYVRNAWGNVGSKVTAEQIAKHR